VYVTSNLARNKRFDNGCAITADSKIIVIKKFILDQTSQKVFVFCNEVSTQVFLRFPQGIIIPPNDHCMKQITYIGRRLGLISVQSLKSVCTITKQNDKMYVSEFPNVNNVF